MTEESSTKVLHVLKNMQKGGVERFILNQYSLLNDHFIRFDIVLYGPDRSKNDQEFMQEFEHMGGRIYYLPYPNSRFLLFYKQFSALLKNNNYNVIHSHQNLFNGIILIIAKINNVPIRIAHAHTSKERKNKNIIRIIYAEIMKNLISYSGTHFLSASSLAGQYVFKKNIISEFLPNGINITSFLKESNVDMRGKLNIPPGSIIFGHVGGFKTIKNHNFIIEIYNSFQKKHPASHLILVGEGEELLSIKHKVNKLNLNDKVHFLGNRNDISDVMKVFDAFLFPSLFEGLGIALIEAQASGVRSIASSSLPREVDIGLNLITFLPLTDTRSWVLEMEKTVFNKQATPEATLRRKYLIEKRFDHLSCSTRLKEIYTNNNRK